MNITWTQERIFNREVFEAWLANQPGERGFEYMDCTACVMSHFITETTSAPLFGVGGDYIMLKSDHGTLPLPKWAIDLLWEARLGFGTFLTIDRLRATYQKLFNIDVLAEYPATITIPVHFQNSGNQEKQ